MLAYFSVEGVVDGFLQPTKMKAYLGAKEIKITWQPPLHTKRGTMAYQVEWREKSKPAAVTNKAETKGHTYTITHLQANTEYDVRVLAYPPGAMPTIPEEGNKAEGVYFVTTFASSSRYVHFGYSD